jgi:hypothetical protein
VTLLLALVLLSVTACTTPPPRELSLAETVKRDCSEAARLLVKAQGAPADVKDPIAYTAAREKRMTKLCIEKRAEQFIRGTWSPR